LNHFQNNLKCVKAGVRSPERKRARFPGKIADAFRLEGSKISFSRRLSVPGID